MTQNQSNTSYALLALALAASLLYRPVIAADPDASQAPGVELRAQAPSEPLQQDFDALMREIEARQPPQDPPSRTAGASTTEEQLNAARIQIGILQQAVIAALAARAEAEAELESLWRDSRAEIDALKAAQGEGAAPTSALGSDLARDKGGARDKGEAASDVRSAAFQPSDAAAAKDSADVAPAAPAELMLNEIHFDPGSATLTPGGERKTLEAADRIKALGARDVRVSGYTDTEGPAAYNMHLSLQRARSIADLLESVGVAAEIIAVEGHGEDGAPVPTADQVSEPLNRCAGIFAMVALLPDQMQP
jgi:outer membrane protein OmpA-like peptidoglycan-associated protein